MRVDFVYAEKGRPANEVSGVSVIGFGSPECPICNAHLNSTAGAPAPKVVVRNEIDDGVLSGTTGFTAVEATSLHLSLRARY